MTSGQKYDGNPYMNYYSPAIAIALKTFVWKKVVFFPFSHRLSVEFVLQITDPYRSTNSLQNVWDHGIMFNCNKLIFFLPFFFLLALPICLDLIFEPCLCSITFRNAMRENFQACIMSFIGYRLALNVIKNFPKLTGNKK